MSEILEETKIRPTAEEERQTSEKFHKMLSDMQIDCLKRFPMEMRVTYLLNIIFRAMQKANTEDEDAFSKTVSWSKVNAILNLEKSPTDFNAYGEIKTIRELQELRYTIISAACDIGPWQKRVCKDCGKEFYLGKSEIDFFVRKELQVPVRCRPCRNKKRFSTQ